MNSEQLKKINELVNSKSKLEELLSICEHELMVRSRLAEYPEVEIDAEILKPALIAYRDKLKSELKELGYEE